MFCHFSSVKFLIFVDFTQWLSLFPRESRDRQTVSFVVVGFFPE